MKGRRINNKATRTARLAKSLHMYAQAVAMFIRGMHQRRRRISDNNHINRNRAREIEALPSSLGGLSKRAAPLIAIDSPENASR